MNVVEDTAPGTTTISNWNYAGGQILFAFLVGGVAIFMIVGLSILLFTGDLSKEMDKDRGGMAEMIVFSVIIIPLGLTLLYRAATRFPIWIEVGDSLTYRTLSGRKTIPWSDVRSLEFVDEQTKLGTKIPGVTIPLGVHRILVFVMSNGQAIRTKITAEHQAAVAAIIKDHFPNQVS